MSRRSSFRLRAAVTAAVVALSLSACSGDDEESPESGPEEIQTSSATDPGVTVTDGDSVVTTYQGIPPDFPLEEDAVLGGEDAVVTGSMTEEDPGASFSLDVESDLAPAEARTEAIGLLEDAGLEQIGDPPADDVAPVALSGDDGDLFVLLTTREEDDGSVLTYGLDVR